MRYARVLTAVAVASLVTIVNAEEKKEEASIQEMTESMKLSSVELGWPEDAKILMIHGDDIGMCHAANEAARIAFPEGRITSASIMMPCPWAYDFCMWAKEHQDKYDIGLHITLTSEWKTYRWGPVLPPSEVPSLCDKEGFLWDDVLPVALRAKAEDIEKEIRAQVKLALKWGVKPTHLDTHMGTVFARPDFVMAFMKVAKEFGITPFLIQPSPFFVKEARKRGLPITPKMVKLLRDFPSAKLDNFTYPEKGEDSSYEGRKARLMKQLRELPPGVTCMIIHPSVLTPELKAITGSAQTRAWELEIFADPEVKKLIKDEGIILTTWRELAKRKPMPATTTVGQEAK